MTSKTPLSFPITEEELAAALAAERRPWARKRLIAIRAVLEGQSRRAAARTARTNADSVRVWIEQVREGGFAGLLRRARTFRATLEQDRMAVSEIETALAREDRPWARQRLAAVHALLSGQSVQAVARAAGTAPTNVHRWLKQLRRGGCSALLRIDSSNQPCQLRMMTKQIEATVREIDAALANEARAWARKRLIAVRAVLEGQSLGMAARNAQVSQRSVSHWFSQMRREGWAALLRNDAADLRSPLRMTKGDIAAARLQIDAALKHEPPRLLRKRLIAVKAVLEGQSLGAAARTTGATPTSVARWVDQVREGGAAALLRDARRRAAAPLPLTLALARDPADPAFAASPTTPFTLPISRTEVAAALASEKRPAIRKRLLAVQRVLCGDSVTDAARATKTKPSTLLRWLRLVQQSGCEVLFRGGRGVAEPPQVITRKKVPPNRHAIRDALPVTLSEITTALASERRASVRKRLLAVRAVIQGQTPADASRSTGLNKKSLYQWLRRAHREGCSVLLSDGR